MYKEYTFNYTFVMPSTNQTYGVEWMWVSPPTSIGGTQWAKYGVIAVTPAPQTPAARLALAVAPPLILGAVLFYVSR
jgi:hypothetical protein